MQWYLIRLLNEFLKSHIKESESFKLIDTNNDEPKIIYNLIKSACRRAIRHLEEKLIKSV